MRTSGSHKILLSAAWSGVKLAQQCDKFYHYQIQKKKKDAYDSVLCHMERYQVQHKNVFMLISFLTKWLKITNAQSQSSI